LSGRESLLAGIVTVMSTDDLAWVLRVAGDCVSEDDSEDATTGRSGLGVELQRQRVARRASRRDRYARRVATQLDADLGRITALAEACQARLTAMGQPDYWARLWDDVRFDHSRASADPMFREIQRSRVDVWDCAMELCRRAAALVCQAGAVDDAPARARLLADSSSDDA
jgi:hypothetical protein